MKVNAEAANATLANARIGTQARPERISAHLKVGRVGGPREKTRGHQRSNGAHFKECEACLHAIVSPFDLGHIWNDPRLDCHV